MRIKDDFIVHDSDGENMLIPTQDAAFTGIVRGNRTLGRIVELLKDETTEEEIIKKMIEIYDVQEDVIRRDVRLVIDKLNEIGALS